MNTDSKIEFDIVLNIMALSPRNRDYWLENFRHIRADLSNQHQIEADGWVGAYVAGPNGYEPFYLFARRLDLDREEDRKKYREIEAKVSELVKKYLRP